MSELSLVTHETEFITLNKRGTFPGELVVGVSLPGSATIFNYGTQPERLKTQDVAQSFEGDTAERIVDFFQQTLANPTETAPSYSCHMFVWYALGKISRLKQPPEYLIDPATFSADRRALVAGRAYATEGVNGIMNHSLIGIDRPDHGLSILGDGSVLAIVDNAELLQTYQGVSMRHITPLHSD